MANSTYKTAGSIPLYAVMAGLTVSMPTSHDVVGQPMSSQDWKGTHEIRLSYLQGNTVMAIRIQPVMTGDTVADNYRPRTELGRKLLALRREFVAAGGQLLDAEALDDEIELRRGGITNA